MYTEKEYRAKLEPLHAENLHKTPPTEHSLSEARDRLHAARERVEQAEQEAQQERHTYVMRYMYHETRSCHVAGINARVQAAKDELQAAQEHCNEASNNPVALALAAQKRSREFEAQAEHAKEQEAEAKEPFRARYLASDGTEVPFAAAWPAMWAKELERWTAESQDNARQLQARMRASGRYAFEALNEQR
ncbi:MAG: hypothetical protein J2P36_40340 [Ktedonobacteraceae bacterium]|nr:hypothetical protein [Ktedonobacteraceae bacterium]